MDTLIGVDIGQKRDPTAICVAEVEDRRLGDRIEQHYKVRYLERLPLGTPYPEVARRVGQIVSRIERRTGELPILYVDATGVGTPVIDLLRDQAVGAEPIGVFFTHGDRRNEDHGEVKLGKAFLVSRLQALLQSGRLHLPRTGEAQVLARELLDYEIRVDENANDRYGAFRMGTHDDLVTAVGLAVQKENVGGYFLS